MDRKKENEWKGGARPKTVKTGNVQNQYKQGRSAAGVRSKPVKTEPLTGTKATQTDWKLFEAVAAEKTTAELSNKKVQEDNMYDRQQIAALLKNQDAKIERLCSIVEILMGDKIDHLRKQMKPPNNVVATIPDLGSESREVEIPNLRENLPSTNITRTKPLMYNDYTTTDSAYSDEKRSDTESETTIHNSNAILERRTANIMDNLAENGAEDNFITSANNRNPDIDTGQDADGYHVATDYANYTQLLNLAEEQLSNNETTRSEINTRSSCGRDSTSCTGRAEEKLLKQNLCR